MIFHFYYCMALEIVWITLAWHTDHIHIIVHIFPLTHDQDESYKDDLLGDILILHQGVQVGHHQDALCIAPYDTIHPSTFTYNK